MYVRIKVLKTSVSTLESDVNREIKMLESDNKLILDVQVLRGANLGELEIVIIKYVEDEERISLNDINDIEEENEEYHSVIKGSKSGKVW